MSSELFYQIALSRIPQIGVVNARRLISYTQSAASIFKAKPEELQKIPHIGPVLAHAIFQQSILAEAESILIACEKAQIQVLFYTDKQYPDRLKQIYDAPLVLYYAGSIDLNQDRFLAVVGTRKATDYGRRMTHSLVDQSLGSQSTFVSGLAYGIDIEVHQRCMQHKIPNIAVLAGGFQHVYPAKHRKYLEDLVANGGILSEHPLHQKPDPRFFPLRNRIIAGMTDATVVVEAAEKGGALITADYANNYHREVFAVPGNVDKLFSEGCNRLIQKNKAVIYTDFKALCIQMNWEQEESQIKQSKDLSWSRLTESESEIMAHLARNGETSLEALAWMLQKKVTDIAVTLLNLEFQGLVKALPGYVYRLKS
jgi:DNA processing protein